MEKYQGDLTDILRATGSSPGGRPVSETTPTVSSVYNWEFKPSDYPIIDQSVMTTTSFGDPFCNMEDPLLLHQINIPGSSFSISRPNSSLDHHHHVINTSTTTPAATSSAFEDNSSTSTNAPANHHDEMMKTPCNIFSRIQISQRSPAQLPVSPPRVVASSGMINANTSTDCLIENTIAPVQTSSPQNLGIKRRKSQAKKVVCIPAPAAPNSRQSGEVVPSDLWAWRKYGQKPIKGSPYPRGYYRCSSSKGCLARKQVERSRTDPNMLVITYTSEHNHPWPTQRSALAGSTRSQPPKTNTNNTPVSSQKTSNTSISTSHQAQAKEDQKESNSNDNSASLSPIMPSTSTLSVKEENNEDFDKNLKNIDHDIDDQFNDVGFQNYRPSLLPSDHNSSDQDFFADFREFEGDPLSLLFSSSTAQEKESIKGMDPFTLFDWSSGDTTATNTQFDNK